MPFQEKVLLERRCRRNQGTGGTRLPSLLNTGALTIVIAAAVTGTAAAAEPNHFLHWKELVLASHPSTTMEEQYSSFCAAVETSAEP